MQKEREVIGKSIEGQWKLIVISTDTFSMC